MNQILYEDTGKSQTTDIKKIIRFFSIAAAIFGIAIIALGIYGIYQWIQSTAPASNNKPKISVNVMEGNNVKIEVTHDKAIDKVLYSWNNEEEKTVLGRGNTFEYLAQMPNGVNELTVRAIDKMGIEATYTGTYSFNNGVDIQNPKIELTRVETENIIRIRATDETEIAYVLYRWNDGEEQKIETRDETNTVIDQVIPLPEEAGDYELTVIAVDRSNNRETKVQKIQGLTKPVILKPTQYGETVTITVTDEQGLDYVTIKVNDKGYKWVSSEENEREFITTVKLNEGESKITIKAKNKSGLEADPMRVKCTYTP